MPTTPIRSGGAVRSFDTFGPSFERNSRSSKIRVDDDGSPLDGRKRRCLESLDHVQRVSDADDRLAALFGFNVGVEVGQLAVVLVSVPVLCWIAAQRRGLLVLRPSVALVICGTGLTLALQRGLAVM